MKVATKEVLAKKSYNARYPNEANRFYMHRYNKVHKEYKKPLLKRGPKQE